MPGETGAIPHMGLGNAEDQTFGQKASACYPRLATIGGLMMSGTLRVTMPGACAAGVIALAGCGGGSDSGGQEEAEAAS